MTNIPTSEQIAGIGGCAIAPRWAHPAGAVAYSGIGRTQLYGLIAAGEIKSVRIARNNRGRAQRLIDLRSSDQWIQSHAGNRNDSPVTAKSLGGSHDLGSL
jgi:hypothetical protein